MTENITMKFSSKPQADDGIQGTVVLGYGPQQMDWLSKAAELCGKGAVIDQDVARMAGAMMAAGPRAALDDLRARLEANAAQSAKQQNPGLSEAAAMWLAGGERGVSSNAIFSMLTGVDASRSWGFDPPSDVADFRRCRLLLEQVPELKPMLPRMKSVSPAWMCLVDIWDDICATMDHEAPDWRKPSGCDAPKTYAMIRAASGR